uniref:Uncharacterized protein n=1 Tax=Panagrolaimus sp. PS1159 TaxID=55785 RepID=A0AC35F223_9BILA
MTYGKGTRIYIYPNWSIGLGWLLSIIPLLFIPGFIIYNIKKFNKKGLSWKELFRLQPKWPSFPRHQMYGTGGVINSSRVWVTDLQQSSPSDSPKQTRL